MREIDTHIKLHDIGQPYQNGFVHFFKNGELISSLNDDSILTQDFGKLKSIARYHLLIKDYTYNVYSGSMHKKLGSFSPGSANIYFAFMMKKTIKHK